MNLVLCVMAEKKGTYTWKQGKIDSLRIDCLGTYIEGNLCEKKTYGSFDDDFAFGYINS